MKSQTHNQGPLKELKVKIEKQVVDALEQMARKTGIPLETHVVIALKRYQTSHADYLGQAPHLE